MKADGGMKHTSKVMAKNVIPCQNHIAAGEETQADIFGSLTRLQSFTATILQ